MSGSRSNKNKFDNGHWSFHTQMDPDKFFGFTYLIWCERTKKGYIGRKQYKHAGKKSSRNFGKETNWRAYAGSSIHLSEHIKQMGRDSIQFICLAEYSCRGDLVWGEVEEQVKRDVLRAKSPDGQRKYFNGQISAIKFIPPNKLMNPNKNLPKEFRM